MPNPEIVKKRSKRLDQFTAELREAIRDDSIPPDDRASILVFNLVEHAMDCLPLVGELVAQADAGRRAQKQEEEQGSAVLVHERLVGRGEENGRPFALVTRGASDVRMPADPALLDQCQVGDSVWVDPKADRIVSRNGSLPSRGEISRVESKSPDAPGHVVVTHHDRRELARLPQSMLDDPNRCLPDDEVVYDPVTRFIEGRITTGSNGDELLADVNTLPRVTDQDLGAPKPELREILDRLHCLATRPEWFEAMRSRRRCSYLFCGFTGSGKSYSTSWILTQYHDLLESLVGRPVSRVVQLNASKLWSSYFGETEQRIDRWITRLNSLAEQSVRTSAGRELYPPLVVVLEECDALLRNRGAHDASSHLFDRPLSLLLGKLDSSENAIRAPMVFLATSNRPDLVDPAALRRLGSRQITFGPLRASEALAVLRKKLPLDMPICSAGQQSEAREALLRLVIGYLYGPTPPQPLVEVRMSNSKHHTLHRRDVVSPAMIDEAISWAVDRCLRRSEKAGRLLGLHSDDVVQFMQRYFASLASNMRPHNVGEYAPDLVAGQSLHVTGVVSLIVNRRPLTTLAG